MGKILGTWIVKVVMREDDTFPLDPDRPAPYEPTIEVLNRMITEAVEDWDDRATVNVTAERTDI